MIHNEPHPKAGQTVTLDDGTEYRVEDWFDRLLGKSWTQANGNAAAMNYAVESAMAGLPLDDEVVYGKIGPFGHAKHDSQIVS